MARTRPQINSTFYEDFEAISGLTFGSEAFRKGAMLIETQAEGSGHLRNVHEIVYKYDKITQIFAVCLPQMKLNEDTGRSFSEALIFSSTNPQYDDGLFIELQVRYKKIPSSNRGRTCCVQKLFLTFRKKFCTQHVLPMFCKKKSF